MAILSRVANNHQTGTEEDECWEFQSVEGTPVARVPSKSSRSTLSDLKSEIRKHDLCVTGDGLAYLQRDHPGLFTESILLY